MVFLFYSLFYVWVICILRLLDVDQLKQSQLVQENMGGNNKDGFLRKRNKDLCGNRLV